MSAASRIGEALQWFGNAQRAGRLAHAYLVIGSPRGDARVFVERVAAQLLCESGGVEACGQCRACGRLAASGAHQDLSVIEPRGKARIIPVDAMRALQRRTWRTALSGGRKIAVIRSADRLGDEAANAFLKTLEEPPPDSIFLLVTDSPASVPSTVRSRCQRLLLSEPESEPPPSESLDTLFTIVENLDGGGGAGWNGFAAAHRFQALCAGMRKEIEQTEKAGFDEEDSQDPEARKARLAARVEARFKEERALLLQALQLWYRDILLTVCGVDAAMLRYPDRRAAARAAARGLRFADALRKLNAIEKMYRQLETNVPDGIVYHAAFSELAGMPAAASV